MNIDYSVTQTFGKLVFDDDEKTYNSEELLIHCIYACSYSYNLIYL